jgi:hypothetical protein
MKKIFLPILLFCLLSIIFVPVAAIAGGLVPCNTNCGIGDFFTMLLNIYNFLVKDIATPLAVVAVTIGGILILISAGNPNLMGKGKTVLFSAIIGLCLAWGSFLIINFIVCTTLGYCGWSSI